eukprot:Gb_19238 [translate_table: standard]
MAKQTSWWNEVDCNATTAGYLKSEPIGVENGLAVGMGITTYGAETAMFDKVSGPKCGGVMQAGESQVDAIGNSGSNSVSKEQDMVLGSTLEGITIPREEASSSFMSGNSVSTDQITLALEMQRNASGSLGYAVMRGHIGNGEGHLMAMTSRGGFMELATGGGEPEMGEDVDGEGKERDEKDHAGKKKRAELRQDAEMDALISAYRQIHLNLMSAGNKGGRNIFKSANEKWMEVRNLLLTVGVDRQPKEIE